MGVFSIIINNIKNMKKAKSFRKMGAEKLLALEDETFYDAITCLCEDAVYEIRDSRVPKEQALVYSLCKLEAEVNNGGLCQFFVNSSGDCAPFISEALETVGATELKDLYDRFIRENGIDVNDLSSFKCEDYEEFKNQTERFDFDSFDDRFYEHDELHQQIIEYARKHIEQLLKP